MRVFTLDVGLFVALAITTVQGFVIPSSTRFYGSSQDRSASFRRRNEFKSTQRDENIEDTITCDVAIFGGGFGGLYTALALQQEARAQRIQLDVALVEPSDQFVFLPLLYDLVVGTASAQEVCPDYKDILKGTGVRQIKASLESLAPDLCTANITTPKSQTQTQLSFRTAVVAVGATPESTLRSVPGASEYAQPFYTQQDAQDTRQLLARLQEQIQSSSRKPRVAIVGGGYGGVELAACVQRKLLQAQVALLTRGPPLKGTLAEPLVDQALQRLGVDVQVCESGVEAIKQVEDGNGLIIQRGDKVDELPWDAVLWTAGSSPAFPVSEEMKGLAQVDSGRLCIDKTLRCIWKEETDINKESTTTIKPPPIWALGDCAEIIVDDPSQPAVPKTAQAAMQQAETVAFNVVAELENKRSRTKSFSYQDLGTMLTLGGPNAAVLAPGSSSPLAPLFTPLLDTARVGLGLADGVLAQISKSPVAEQMGLTPALVKNLGLSLGGYGLGVDPEVAPGTLAGTLTGAARRAVYAVRMPTNRQRAFAAASAAISTATALAKEASDQLEKNGNNDKNST